MSALTYKKIADRDRVPLKDKRFLKITCNDQNVQYNSHDMGTRWNMLVKQKKVEAIIVLFVKIHSGFDRMPGRHKIQLVLN